MDFKELKDIIQRDGGKIIIVENDEPQLVLMSFEEYKKKRSPASPRAAQGGSVQKSDDLPDQEREREELTIDDLPLS